MFRRVMHMRQPNCRLDLREAGMTNMDLTSTLPLSPGSIAMSLVPSRQQVIRRVNETSVVVFNPIGNQLAVVNDQRRRKRKLKHIYNNYCPQCGQSIHEEEQRQDYFLILEEYNRVTPSQPASPASTPAPGTPAQEYTPATSEEISSLSFSQGYFDRFFKSMGLLGRGSRAAVYRVEHVLEGISIGHYALKKIPVGYNTEWLRKVLTEVNFLRRLSHPNLVRYNHVWLEVTALSDFGPPVPCAYLLQEYCDGGTLEDYCESRKGELGLEEIRKYMADIGAGIEHLHSQGLVHCDLKPSNCLLKLGGKYPRVLVSDFGESQVEGSRRVGTGSTGTLEYCAPEVLLVNGTYPPFSRASDMFSVGMSMYYLCFGKLPYSDRWAQEQNVDLLLDEVRKFKFQIDEEKMRPDLLELLPLLRQLLDAPENRPSAAEFCQRLRWQGGDSSHCNNESSEVSHTKRVKWRNRINPNHLRLVKLASIYFIEKAFALNLCVVLAALELAIGRLSEELFILHFTVLLLSLLV